MKDVLTEKSFQKLCDCKCEVFSVGSLARLLGCHYAKAKSLMFLTNNVFYQKRKGNPSLLVAKKLEVLQVIRKILDGDGVIPEKEYLEYPRNLICILFCGEIPNWVREQEVLQAVSQLNSKGRVLMEALYQERLSKRQVQKKLEITQDKFKILEQNSLRCLLQSLESGKRGGVDSVHSY